MNLSLPPGIPSGGRAGAANRASLSAVPEAGFP